MIPKLAHPMPLFLNPFAFWADFALKAGQAMWASAHASAMRSNSAAKVGALPTAEAPALRAQDLARPAELIVAPAQTEAPRKATALRSHKPRVRVQKRASGKRSAKRR